MTNTTTEKSTIKTEAIFSEDRDYRYLLRKEWDKTKAKAMVIMINPSKADHLLLDQTTMYVINNLAKLDFGSVEIVNLYATIGNKLYINDDSHTQQSQKENDQQILKSAENADTIILAWGKVGNSFKAAKKRQNEVLKALQTHWSKLHIIAVPGNPDGLHPLAPAVRMQWNLKPYTPPDTSEQEKALPAQPTESAKQLSSI